ncbi:MAG TPA: hypothetical protein DIT13_01750 [Verrucomicrobiales bacterium]|nr:hypothetical protein [Verrucomicrobiales bacterium]HRJ07520.1 FecR domain-containing protein [Prosthecobacter sp.]HRK12766.1 FecR domain-containing protein [Prosthecobacter sp.]
MSTEREKDFRWIESYLSGRATAEEVKALDARLSADAELRREFLRYAHVDAALKTMVRPVSQQPLSAAKAKTTVWRSQTVRWAAAAVFLLAGVLALWMPRGVEVRVMAVSDDAASIWPKDSTQRLREVRLEKGSVQLRLDSGVTLDLTAPVRLHLADAMHTTLLAGSVTADVGERGHGFTIDTTSAHVVDLGTRFGVSLLDDGDTEVAVFQGKVEVSGPKSAKDQRNLVTLSAGDSVRVNSVALIRRQALIATRGDSAFVLEPPPPDALVTGMTDNIEEDGFHLFYTIQRGAMKPGVRPYSTLGRPRWLAMPGAEFPSELVGADVIGTFSADRYERDLRLEVSVSRACTVYVMLDTRGEVPEWVRRDFTDTGFRLRSGPWAGNPVVEGMTADANGEIHVDYTVWKKAVPAAGAITLGPPYPLGGATHRAMYGIAVK